jgi:hypothetical protein
MRNGAGTAFVKVPLLPDNGLITKAYLHDMEAAVKQRTPIAGDNITIKVTDGSYVISATAGVNIAVAGGGEPDGFTVVTLTVCSNGIPATITVLSK